MKNIGVTSSESVSHVDVWSFVTATNLMWNCILRKLFQGMLVFASWEIVVKIIISFEMTLRNLSYSIERKSQRIDSNNNLVSDGMLITYTKP